MSQPSLRRTLGTWDLVFLVVGTVIGSGIFVVPSVVLRQVGGSVGLALAVWLGGGVISLLGGFTYGELAAMDRGSGGVYTYVRDAFGPFFGFLYGWTLFLVISTGSVAALSVAATVYIGQFVPLDGLTRNLVAIGLIAIMAITNIRGTRRSATLQNATTAIKLTAIATMGVLLLWRGSALKTAFTGPDLWPHTIDASLIAGIGAAMIAILWAYEGWQYVTFAAGESVDPQRSFPRAMTMGMIALIAIYVFANIAYIGALGSDGVMKADRVAADSIGHFFGPVAAKVIAAAIALSMFSAANGLTLTSPRAYYTMARDGNFFTKFAEVHPRFGTPAFAIGVSSVWSAVLAITGTFEQLLTYVVFIGWIFYALGGCALIIFRRTRPNADRPFRVPGYPITPVLFLLAASWIVVSTVVTKPKEGIIGIAVVLAGAPAYIVWRRRSQRNAQQVVPIRD